MKMDTAAIMAVGRTVIQREAEALTGLGERLNHSFAEAVQLISKHKGRVILCGVGKSGLIARKIASTFSSTGTPALFLHAGEAVHGDLGAVQQGDPVVVLSKSGATGELVRLLPSFKAQGNPIIAIVGNADSPIAVAADLVLNTTVKGEADPLGIVPTTSALVMLAVGDALASALMQVRGFGSAEFARFHPSGQLGRNLLMKVGDVMHRVERIACAQPQTSIRELVIVMTQHSHGAACVIDEQGNLVGLVTDGDIRRGLRREVDIVGGTVADLMTVDPISVAESISLGEALTLMEDRPNQISVLPVVAAEGRRCLGLLRLHDIYQPYLY